MTALFLWVFDRHYFFLILSLSLEWLYMSAWVVSECVLFYFLWEIGNGLLKWIEQFQGWFSQKLNIYLHVSCWWPQLARALVAWVFSFHLLKYLSMMPCGIRLDLFPFVLLWYPIFLSLCFPVSFSPIRFLLLLLLLTSIGLFFYLYTQIDVKANDMIFVNANTHLRVFGYRDEHLAASQR